jgi:hypothetical protein
MTDEWGRVVEGGEYCKPSQLNGHLCIVFPLGHHPFIATKFSGQGNKPSDGIAVDVVDLDDKNDQGLPGKVYRNSNFMQAQLIGSLRSQIGAKVLGVFSQGVARNGMNPPWVLVDMSGDPMARERASAWLQANPNFQASPFAPIRNQTPAETTPAGYSYQGGTPQGYTQPPAGQQFQGSPSLESMRANNNAAPPAPAQPQQQYAGVAGSPQLSQEDMTVLQHHRQQRMLAEQAAAAEAARQATFNDTPPF